MTSLNKRTIIQGCYLAVHLLFRLHSSLHYSAQQSHCTLHSTALTVSVYIYTPDIHIIILTLSSFFSSFRIVQLRIQIRRLHITTHIVQFRQTAARSRAVDAPLFVRQSANCPDESTQATSVISPCSNISRSTAISILNLLSSTHLQD